MAELRSFSFKSQSVDLCYEIIPSTGGVYPLVVLEGDANANIKFTPRFIGGEPLTESELTQVRLRDGKHAYQLPDYGIFTINGKTETIDTCKLYTFSTDTIPDDEEDPVGQFLWEGNKASSVAYPQGAISFNGSDFSSDVSFSHDVIITVEILGQRVGNNGIPAGQDVVVTQQIGTSSTSLYSSSGHFDGSEYYTGSLSCWIESNQLKFAGGIAITPSNDTSNVSHQSISFTILKIEKAP